MIARQRFWVPVVGIVGSRERGQSGAWAVGSVGIVGTGESGQLLLLLFIGDHSHSHKQKDEQDEKKNINWINISLCNS